MDAVAYFAINRMFDKVFYVEIVTLLYHFVRGYLSHFVLMVFR